jgi:hypothetical protein
MALVQKQILFFKLGIENPDTHSVDTGISGRADWLANGISPIPPYAFEASVASVSATGAILCDLVLQGLLPCSHFRVG